MKSDWDLDHCYECRGYGDDYYFDDDGELVSACDDCPFNGDDEDDCSGKVWDPKQ